MVDDARRDVLSMGKCISSIDGSGLVAHRDNVVAQLCEGVAKETGMDEVDSGKRECCEIEDERQHLAGLPGRGHSSYHPGCLGL